MELFAFILAIIALGVAIMALPLLSKPKWRVDFDSAKGYKLWCWIRNPPVTNRVLIWMGYERRKQSINSTIAISDSSGATIQLLTYETTSSDDIRRGIAEIKSKNNGKVFLKDVQDGFDKELQVGLYTLELELWGYSGRHILKKVRNFRVNHQYPFVEWVPKM
jgi:hypothetical protein